MFCPNPECPHARDTGEPAEYRVGVVRCADCGTDLVETLPDVERDALHWEAFVPVLQVPSAAVVPLVESLLQSEGIRYFVKGETVQDLFGGGRFGTGFNPITGPPVVCVEPARAEEARELLEELVRDVENGRGG